MATTKRVKRNVIGITASRDLTQQGNPKEYWYVLDCGHAIYEYYTAKLHLQYMMMNVIKDHDFPITKFCDQCQRNKPANPEMIFNIIGMFRSGELNDKMIDMYKKFKPQTA